MNAKVVGQHTLVLKNQMVLAAQEMEPLGEDILVRFRGTEVRVRIDQIAQIYATEHSYQFPIDSGLLPTLATFEEGITLYEAAGGESCRYTISSVAGTALTIIFDRSSKAHQITANEPLAKFLSERLEVEFVDEGLLNLMGNWTSRISLGLGPMGHEFQLMHPLDTVMRKMLQWDIERFSAKDMADIDEIILTINPSSETIRGILSENPFRYAKAAGPLKMATDAIEANTRLFLTRYLPGVSYDSIVIEANQKYFVAMERAGLTLSTRLKADRIRRMIVPLGNRN